MTAAVSGSRAPEVQPRLVRAKLVEQALETLDQVIEEQNNDHLVVLVASELHQLAAIVDLLGDRERAGSQELVADLVAQANRHHHAAMGAVLEFRVGRENTVHDLRGIRTVIVGTNGKAAE